LSPLIITYLEKVLRVFFLSFFTAWWQCQFGIRILYFLKRDALLIYTRQIIKYQSH